MHRDSTAARYQERPTCLQLHLSVAVTVTRSLRFPCSSEVSQPLTGNNALPSIRLCARLPESMRDTPTQRNKGVKEAKLLSPRRQTETRESELHHRVTHRVETDRTLLTDDRGENREAPLRVVLCRCAFPQRWHVIFRGTKAPKHVQYPQCSQTRRVGWGRCVLGPAAAAASNVTHQ